MAKPRSIAPLHREGLEEADLEAMSAENVELLASLKGEAQKAWSHQAHFVSGSRVTGDRVQ